MLSQAPIGSWAPVDTGNNGAYSASIETTSGEVISASLGDVTYHIEEDTFMIVPAFQETPSQNRWVLTSVDSGLTWLKEDYGGSDSNVGGTIVSARACLTNNSLCNVFFNPSTYDGTTQTVFEYSADAGDNWSTLGTQATGNRSSFYTAQEFGLVRESENIAIVSSDQCSWGCL